MKKIIPLSIIGLVVISMFSSCVSLTKRHYNKGYHVSWHHKARAQPVASKTETSTASHENITTVVQEITHENQSNSFNAPEVRHADVPAVAEKNIQSAATQISPLVQNPAIANDEPTVKPAAKKIRAAARDIKKVNLSDDELSLFWIVILIIFLFWAVGFLTGGFGIGGLINLLLVVVLILLVLWLLRIL